MNRATAFRALAKPFVFLVALAPLGRMLSQLFFGGVGAGGLGADPIRELQLRTGWWALAFLTVTLAVTPLRVLTGWNALVRFRRMLGLFAYFYGVLHLVNYVVVDQFFAWDAIVEDVVKRPWITVGVTALLLLTPLALTSTQGMIRRLGKRWAALHRLAYVAAALGVVHFLWLVKLDTGEPSTFGLIIVALLAVRLRAVRRASRPAPSRSPTPAEAEPA